MCASAHARTRRAAVIRGHLRRVLINERDRTSFGAARRPCNRLALGLLGGQPERGDDRRRPIVVEAGEGGVDARHRACGVERSGEHLVEVDRARELAEHPVSPPLLLRVLERLRQLADHCLHARVHVGHEVGEALVALRPLTGAADEPEHDQQQAKNCRSRGYGYDDRRRQSDQLSKLIPPPKFPDPPPTPQLKRARPHCNSTDAA